MARQMGVKYREWNMTKSNLRWWDDRLIVDKLRCKTKHVRVAICTRFFDLAPFLAIHLSILHSSRM